jgi:hypothetical protein
MTSDVTSDLLISRHSLAKPFAKTLGAFLRAEGLAKAGLVISAFPVPTTKSIPTRARSARPRHLWHPIRSLAGKQLGRGEC